MPSYKYGTIPTDIGIAKITNAVLTGERVNWTKICVGDGSGSEYVPEPTQTNLRNQMWEGNISDITLAENTKNQITIHAVIPSNIGGFFIREIGILDEENNLVAIGNVPEQYKATSSEGVLMDMDLYVHVGISHAEVVNIVVDPNVVIASKGDIKDLRDEIYEKLAEFSAVEALTTQEIEEITQMPISATVVIGDNLSEDEVSRILDDDPYNDPVDFSTNGALTRDEISKILGE